MYLVFYRFLPKLCFLSKLFPLHRPSRSLHHSSITTEMFGQFCKLALQREVTWRAGASNPSWEKWSINGFGSAILSSSDSKTIPNNSIYLETPRPNFQKFSKWRLSKNKRQRQLEADMLRALSQDLTGKRVTVNQKTG